MSENAIHEYLLILRVGCASNDFDRHNSCIDIEILGENDEIIGNPIRFDCSRLKDLVCSEMHCIFKRLTPMPEISAIRASHSNRRGPHGFHNSKSNSSVIFFYEFELHDRTTSMDKIIDFRLVLDYIGHRPRIFRGFVPKKKPNKDDNSDMIGIYPQLPIMALTTVEVLILSCLTVVLCGTLCMLFESANLYWYKRQEWNGSMYRSLQDLLFVAPITLALIMANVFVYKYNIKRLAVRYEYSISQIDSNKNYMKYCAKSYLLFITKSIMACEAIIIYFALRKSSSSSSTTLSWYWLSSTLLTSSTVLGVWSCLNKMNCLTTIYDDGNVHFESWWNHHQTPRIQLFNDNQSSNKLKNSNEIRSNSNPNNNKCSATNWPKLKIKTKSSKHSTNNKQQQRMGA